MHMMLHKYKIKKKVEKKLKSISSKNQRMDCFCKINIFRTGNTLVYEPKFMLIFFLFISNWIIGLVEKNEYTTKYFIEHVGFADKNCIEKKMMIYRLTLYYRRIKTILPWTSFFIFRKIVQRNYCIEFKTNENSIWSFSLKK